MSEDNSSRRLLPNNDIVSADDVHYCNIDQSKKKDTLAKKGSDSNEAKPEGDRNWPAINLLSIRVFVETL